MKKEILLLLSLALTVFSLSTVVLTISTVSNINHFQTSQAGNTLAAQGKSTPATLKAASTSNENVKEATQVLPQTLLDEKTAMGIAQSDAGMAVLASNNADLVDVNGQVAYEVLFNLGKVYVDANSGMVLGNTIQITPEIAIQEASSILKMNQVIRVTLGAFQGQNYYIVQFRGGVNAYVSMKGVVTYISTTQPYNGNSEPNSQSNENDN